MRPAVKLMEKHMFSFFFSPHPIERAASASRPRRPSSSGFVFFATVTYDRSLGVWFEILPPFSHSTSKKSGELSISLVHDLHVARVRP